MFDLSTDTLVRSWQCSRLLTVGLGERGIETLSAAGAQWPTSELTHSTAGHDEAAGAEATLRLPGPFVDASLVKFLGRPTAIVVRHGHADAPDSGLLTSSPSEGRQTPLVPFDAAAGSDWSVWGRCDEELLLVERRTRAATLLDPRSGRARPAPGQLGAVLARATALCRTDLGERVLAVRTEEHELVVSATAVADGTSNEVVIAPGPLPPRLDRVHGRDELIISDGERIRVFTVPALELVLDIEAPGVERAWVLRERGLVLQAAADRYRLRSLADHSALASIPELERLPVRHVFVDAAARLYVAEPNEALSL